MRDFRVWRVPEREILEIRTLGPASVRNRPISVAGSLQGVKLQNFRGWHEPGAEIAEILSLARWALLVFRFRQLGGERGLEMADFHTTVALFTKFLGESDFAAAQAGDVVGEALAGGRNERIT